MFSNRIVNCLMDFNLISTMHGKDCLCYVIARLVKPLHCFAEHLVLLRGGIELYHQGLKHYTEDYLQWINSCWCEITAGYAPPMTKVMGFCYPCTPRFS